MRSTLLPILAGGLVLATLLTIYVLPQLFSVLLLIFAGVILAVLLDALTTALDRVLPGGRGVAYPAMLLCVVLVLSGIGMLIGPHIAEQLPQLIHQIPESWNSLIAKLNNYAMMQTVVDKAREPFQWFASNTQIMNLVSSTFGALFNVFIIVLVGFYAAAAPEHYLRIGRYLVPAQIRCPVPRSIIF